MDARRRCKLYLHLAFLPMAVCGCECVHRRQSVYPGGSDRAVQVQTGKGVRVRAPFVDVQVPESSEEAPAMLGE